MTTGSLRGWELTYPSDQPGRIHYLILVLLLAAGAFLRFWRLANVGLYGDEDLMALAARGVLQHGTPLMPGGLTYPRAPIHTWLLASSIRLFGENEWALRMPSAVAGTLCGWLAFVMGRRFLAPTANLAFVATILFLPSLILDSLTARMYIFFITCLLGFGAAVFRWERTGRLADLALAFFVWLLAVQFQFLAFMASPLFLFPGLIRGSRPRLLQGAVAMALAGMCYVAIEKITDHFYPGPSQHPPIPPEPAAPDPVLLVNPYVIGAIAVLAAAAILTLLLSVRQRPLLPAAVALGWGVAACAFQQYHLGGILLIVGVLLWLRSGEGHARTLGVVLGAMAVIAALQIWMLHDEAVLPWRKTAAALIGRPGLWPFLRFAEHTPVGAVAYLGVLALAAVRWARRRPIPDHILVFILAVWVQLLGVASFRRDVPIRYTIGALPFFLLCLIAGLVYLFDATRAGARLRVNPATSVAVWAIAVGLIVNPAGMLRTARNDYSTAPDHKGAAEYIRGLHPGAGDLLIAEDSIVQTWYLGRVDYRLLDMRVAAEHSVVVDGVVRGQYCGTPVLGSGRELDAVLAAPRSGHVYVIGSGEDFENGRRTTRGNGIQEALDSGRFDVVYRGRDHRTVVWRLRG
jgi:hypothetical protein